MPKPTINKPYIEFQLEGVIALCLRADHFDVGIIKDATGAGSGTIPDHDFLIEVRKKGEKDPLRRYHNGSLPKRFSLDLHQTLQGQSSTPRLRLFRPSAFNRKIGSNDVNHFNWFVDLEGAELNGAPKSVTINPKALRSVLRVSGIEDGDAFADKVTDESLLIKDKGTPKTLGRVAGALKVLIPLPAGGATFKAGSEDQLPLPWEKNIIYEIKVEQICQKNACRLSNVTHIYKELFDVNKPDDQKILFIDALDKSGNPSILLNPEVGCIGTNLSVSTELPDPA